MGTADEERRDRLKAALRDNLKRRKAQARERAAKPAGAAYASSDRSGEPGRQEP